ncbi:MAG: succinyl-CoA:(R)-citramalate CoA-transferase [Blastococcus sp.]|jgi:formyl-CoA transferase|nr:succinyl-CoA:(R)-citramalate CoA-transferase [Blastococcus sp.]
MPRSEPAPAESADPPAGPLAGYRVLELGQLIAGPFCGQLLGDMGAEVIKVEPPGVGDAMRQWGQVHPKGQSLWWSVIARNKKSVTIDLRTEDGRAAVKALVSHCDVVVENFRPGRMEEWGLTYEALAEINPGVVMVRVSGFGQTGPYASRAGFGAIGEAMGGLRYIVGEPDQPPVRTGIAIGDALAGTMGAYAALAALLERGRSGRGQEIDVAIYESVLAFMESLVPEYQVAGYLRERTGATLPGVAPSNAYPTADGASVLIAANQDSVFRRFAAVMGQPELGTDPRYATHTARGNRQAELDELVGAWTATRESGELVELLAEHGVPAGMIYRPADMLTDPQFRARGSILEVPHPIFGRLAMQAVAPRLSRTPGAVRWVGPELGEHNDEILGGLLGLDNREVAPVRETGAAPDGLPR